MPPNLQAFKRVEQIGVDLLLEHFHHKSWEREIERKRKIRREREQSFRFLLGFGTLLFDSADKLEDI